MKLSPRTIAYLIAATVVLLVVFSSCMTPKKAVEQGCKCQNRIISTTLMDCVGGPCNTCKCLSCGYTWSCW